VLRNDNFIGNTVYNRVSNTLGEGKINNPHDLWIRTEGLIPPVIDRALFLRAQRRLLLRWLHLTDEELLFRLKRLLEKEGRLSETIINRTLGVPAINATVWQSPEAYRQIGYEPKWDFDWIDRKAAFSRLLEDVGAELAVRLEHAGLIARFAPGIDVLTINERWAVSLRIARCWRGTDRKPIWTINRRQVLPAGHIIAIRLDEGNNCILDYLLFPATEMAGTKMRFMEAGLDRFDGKRFQTSATLARAVIASNTGCASAATRRRLSRLRSGGQPKRKAGRELH
jgi:hypothetical protein